jgi:hypothetical protein
MIELGVRPHLPGIPSTAGHVRYRAHPKPRSAACRRPAPALRTWWLALLLVVLGAGWGLQFTLLKISVDANLDELGILASSMVLLAVIYALLLTWRVCPSAAPSWLPAISRPA